MALSAAASLVSLELSNALSTDFVDGMAVGVMKLLRPFLPRPFPAEPAIALAAEPEPHIKRVSLPFGRRALGLALVLSLIVGKTRPASLACRRNCPPEARS